MLLCSVLLLIYAPMAAVGYFEIGDAVTDNIVNSMCNGPVSIKQELETELFN